MKYIPLFLFCCTLLHGNEIVPLTTQEKIEKFSEYIGSTLGHQLSMMKIAYDADAIKRGLEKYTSGEMLTSSSDLSSEMSLVLQIQEEIFEMKAKQNLLHTEQFFTHLEKDTKIKEIVPKELYIKKLQDGKGTDYVIFPSKPLLHYSAKTFEEIPIANTFESGSPIRISLLEAIPGFAKGVEGMKVGEKRSIYIHPNLAYKRRGLVPPNSVLIFEVEVVEL